MGVECGCSKTTYGTATVRLTRLGINAGDVVAVGVQIRIITITPIYRHFTVFMIIGEGVGAYKPFHLLTIPTTICPSQSAYPIFLPIRLSASQQNPLNPYGPGVRVAELVFRMSLQICKPLR